MAAPDVVPRLPNGWVNCPRQSSVINRYILVFKTPLSCKYDGVIPEESRFTIDDLNSELKHHEIISLIDLTKSLNDFDSSKLDEGVMYTKALHKDFHGLPDQKVVRDFFELMENMRNRNPFGITAIIGNLGYNLVGFMIVSYLVVVSEYTLEEAFEIFQENRLPGIFKPKYFLELKLRYDVHISLSFRLPPQWFIEARRVYLQKVGKHFGIVKASKRIRPKDDEHDLYPSPKRRRMDRRSDMDIIPVRQSPESNQIPELNAPPSCPNKKSKCPAEDGERFMVSHDLVGYDTDEENTRNRMLLFQHLMGTTKYGFLLPPYQKVTNYNLNDLKKEEYFHTWRTDGQRYMMVIYDENDVFFVSENHRIFRINGMAFFQSDGRKLTKTILDGEMVFNRSINGFRHSYLVSNIILLNGVKVITPHLMERMSLIMSYIIVPRKLLKLVDQQREPFDLVPRNFYEMIYLKKTYRVLPKSLAHVMTGLLFFPANDEGYNSVRRSPIMLWEEPKDTIVNFRLKFQKSTFKNRIRWIANLHTRVVSSPKVDTILMNNNSKEKYDDKVVGCRFDSFKRRWSIDIKVVSGQLPINYLDFKNTMDLMRKSLDFQRLLWTLTGMEDTGPLANMFITKY